jgi:hypothetical protein
VRPPHFLVYSSLDVSDDLLRLSTQGALVSKQNKRQMNVPNVSSTPSALVLNPVSFVSILALPNYFQSTEQIIFCTESRLIRTNFNGTKGDVLLEDRALKSLRGMDIDWTTGNIYWYLCCVFVSHSHFQVKWYETDTVAANQWTRTEDNCMERH